MANIKCSECGCTCKRCTSSDHDVHLHVEIENLKQKLAERENHIVMMETNFLNESNKFPNGELVAMKDELLTWQDKYRRLYDAHRRVQRVNQGLEDKLLKLVDVCETEKTTLTKDVATLSHRLAEANYTIKKLSDDNDRYKKDVSLAIQFLQCKQSNFVAHKFDSLPQETQSQISSFMTTKRKPEEKSRVEMKNIKVPIPTFPPTAMVYSVPKSPNLNVRQGDFRPEPPQVDVVSAAIMAKILEERQKERAFAKHCDTCSCSQRPRLIYDKTHHTLGTQTDESKDAPCSRCDDNSTTPNSNMRIVRNVDKVVCPPDIGESHQNQNNIVKVQPNNFLIDEQTTTAQIDANNTSPIDNNNEMRSMLELTGKVEPKIEHHYLCSKSSPGFVVEKCDSDKTSAKHSSSENLKGPRYCSMRLQSGTRNILLDNAHNNVAPVLYTRHHQKGKREECGASKVEERSQSRATQSTSSEDLKNNSIMSDNSIQNQQRVADWIKNNLENEIVGSTDNSQSEALIRSVGADPKTLRYAEMEEHVKRFLFGESEFLKTVEIGKLKYQTLRENETSALEQDGAQISGKLPTNP